MKKKIYQFILSASVAVAAIGILTAVPVAAQINPIDASCKAASNNSKEICNASGSLFGNNSIWENIISTIIFLIGAAAVLAIIYGGSQYILAAGDDSQIKTAKNTILYAVAGLIVAVAAYGIVEFVLNRL